MQNQTTNGYKKTKPLIIRLDKIQHQRLEAMASAEGYATISQYVREKIFEPSVEIKINKILDLLNKK